MSREIEVIKEKIDLLSGVHAYRNAGDSKLNEKIEILKEATLALLDEVEALADVHSLVNIRHGISLYQEVQHFERDLIQQALERTGGHQTHAARLLGLNLTTLHNKIKRYQIRVVDWEESESVIEASGAQQ